MPGELLPLFPLRMVVFPGEDVNLHIFEDRYKQLVLDCFDNKSSFGIPPFIKNKVMKIGTEISIESIERTYEDGKMDIRTRAIGTFEIKNFLEKAPNKLYAAGSVHRLPFEESFNPVVSQNLFETLKKLLDLLQLLDKLPQDALSIQAHNFAHFVGLNIEQQYQLLELHDEVDRQQFLLSHLDRLLPAITRFKAMKEKAQMNGHFRKIKPPHF